MFQPFYIGESVQLKNGWTPMIVRDVDHKTRRHRRTGEKFTGWWIRAQYPSQVKWYGENDQEGWEDWRPAEDYISLEKGEDEMENEEVRDTVANGALFQTKEAKPRFGTKIAVNSRGETVLEMKGKDGDVEAFQEDKIEEVVPHTVRLRKLAPGKTSGNIHVQVPAGSVKKDDILLDIRSGEILTVIETDTKCRSASKVYGKMVRLKTEPVDLD